MDAQTQFADTLGSPRSFRRSPISSSNRATTPSRLVHADEVIHENRFLAARDGMDAIFIDPVGDRRVAAVESLDQLLLTARWHAAELGCEDALQHVVEMAHETGASRQRQIAKAHSVGRVSPALADLFTARLGI